MARDSTFLSSLAIFAHSMSSSKLQSPSHVAGYSDVSSPLHSQYFMVLVQHMTGAPRYWLSHPSNSSSSSPTSRPSSLHRELILATSRNLCRRPCWSLHLMRLRVFSERRTALHACTSNVSSIIYMHVRSYLYLQGQFQGPHYMHWQPSCHHCLAGYLWE